MVFRIDDEVVEVRNVDRPGIIRAKYKRQYLIEYPEAERWCRFTHCTSNDLLPVDSPLIEQLRDMDFEIRDLDKKIDEIYNKRKQILKQK